MAAPAVDIEATENPRRQFSIRPHRLYVSRLSKFFRCDPALVDATASDDDDTATAEDIQVNLHSVVMYKLRHENGTFEACKWAACGLGTVLLQLLACFGINLHCVAPSCLYLEDCQLGSVCARVSSVETLNRTDTHCYPCDEDHIDFSLFTNVKDEVLIMTTRSQAGFVTGNLNRTTYCEQQLQLPKLATWPSPPRDYHWRCLFVWENYLKFTAFGKVILALCILLVAICMASERQQQLMNKRVRTMWFPTPWSSWRAGVLRLTDALDARSTLPNLMIAYVLLLGATSFEAQDTLLNGLSITFILTFDDLLVNIVVTGRERVRIAEEMAHAASGKLVARHVLRQANVFLLWVVVAMVVGMACLITLPCRQGQELVVYLMGFGMCNFGSAVIDLLIEVRMTGADAPRAARLGAGQAGDVLLAATLQQFVWDISARSFF